MFRAFRHLDRFTGVESIGRWRSLALLGAIALALPGLALAQSGDHGGHASPSADPKCETCEDRPYAGMQNRKIKAISNERIDGLLTGKGLGYALAAELNGYPGPRHVLDMADSLALDSKQREKTRALFERMQAEAIPLGKAIVEQEKALDDAFAAKRIDAVSLETMLTGIAELEGRLRAAHLSAHLEMQGILSTHQAMLYGRMRGYEGTNGQPMDHRSH